MAPEVGLEPTTNRLTADRSTTELLRNVAGRVSKSWAEGRINPFAAILATVEAAESLAKVKGCAATRDWRAAFGCLSGMAEIANVRDAAIFSSVPVFDSFGRHGGLSFR